MGGRGRGRGRGASMSFNVEALGFTRGEALPQAALAPPPLYPALSTKPLPLVQDVAHDYMLVIKKELANFWRDSPFYVTPPAARGSIERYTDKYQETAGGALSADRHCDMARIPAELSVAAAPARRRKRSASGRNPAPKPNKVVRNAGKDLKVTFAKLEEKEKQGEDEAETKEGEKDDELGSDEEVAETEDVELDDGTDYAQDYFDNGEDYLDPEDDALEEGPIF